MVCGGTWTEQTQDRAGQDFRWRIGRGYMRCDWTGETRAGGLRLAKNPPKKGPGSELGSRSPKASDPTAKTAEDTCRVSLRDILRRYLHLHQAKGNVSLTSAVYCSTHYNSVLALLTVHCVLFLDLERQDKTDKTTRQSRQTWQWLRMRREESVTTPWLLVGPLLHVLALSSKWNKPPPPPANYGVDGHSVHDD